MEYLIVCMIGWWYVLIIVRGIYVLNVEGFCLLIWMFKVKVKSLNKIIYLNKSNFIIKAIM